jgi:hypothetical protein
MMVDYRFEWSFDQTREENYRRWRQLNNAERDAYNIAQELEGTTTVGSGTSSIRTG